MWLGKACVWGFSCGALCCARDIHHILLHLRQCKTAKYVEGAYISERKIEDVGEGVIWHDLASSPVIHARGYGISHTDLAPCR
jgi:hypothetical protein